MYLEEKSRGTGLQEPVAPWRKVLLEAAERIERQGWCQYQFCDQRGRMCVSGAIYQIVRLPRYHGWFLDGFTDTARLAQRIMEENLQCSMAEWNDEEGRTKQQVVDKLREVAVWDSGCIRHLEMRAEAESREGFKICI